MAQAAKYLQPARGDRRGQTRRCPRSSHRAPLPRAATESVVPGYHTLIRPLAASGIRIGEAIKLDRLMSTGHKACC